MTGLTKRTRGILNNFSMINPSIYIAPGSEVMTTNIARSIVGRAKVDETFEHPISIYDLKHFDSVMSMFDEPVMSWKDTHVIVTEGKSTQRYNYASPDSINPKVERVPPELTWRFSVKLSGDDLAQLTKAFRVNASTNLVLSSEGGKFRMVVGDVNPDTGQLSRSMNQFSMDFEESPKEEFFVILSEVVFSVIKADYTLGVYWDSEGKSIVHLEAEGLEYWVAVEPKSRFPS